MTHSVDTTIFDKKHRFLGVFIVTSLIGIMLISLAVYRASQELEIIHEVDNMSRLMPFILGEVNLERMIHGDYKPERDKTRNMNDSGYLFFILSENNILPLQNAPVGTEKSFLPPVELESTRVNPRGGYYELDDNIQTWIMLKSDTNKNSLLVLHTFKRTSGALAYVYKQRMIIPIIFYIWLMVWVTVIFNHLLQKLKTNQDEIKHMALHDALTGLPNRNLMDDRLQKLIQASQRDGTKFACSLMDLNDFKAINDDLGHAYGDEILKQASKRLESCLRESDTAARIGGDEFVVLLNHTDEHTWSAAFSRIQAVLNEPYTIYDAKITIGASIGVSIYSVHGSDAESLLRNADQAMYNAKSDNAGLRIYEAKYVMPEKRHARLV